VDEELEAQRRTAQSFPDDTAATLRFVRAAQRAGRYGEAWASLRALPASSQHGRRGKDVLGAVKSLAASSPAATVQELKRAHERAGTIELLMRSGARAALVVLALKTSTQVGDAALAALGTEVDFGGAPRFLRPGELRRCSEGDLSVWHRPDSHGWRPSGAEFVQAFIRNAHETHLRASVPWLSALTRSREPGAASLSASALRDLTGLRAPPFDLAALTLRWDES
jgi:hypothetical protein